MPHDPDGIDAAAGAKSPAAATFEAQVLALLPSLRRYAHSLTRSDADGEDLLQDCVERALAHRGQWRGLNLRSWLLTIMTNLYRNGLRRRSRHDLVDIDDTIELAAEDTDDDPLQRTRLQAALAGLPAENRAILMLVVVEGYRYQEVATIMDMPIGTVMSRLSRTRQRLASLMNAENVVTLRRPK